MFLQFNVDNIGKITTINSALIEYKYNDLLPYCVEVSKEEEQLISNDAESFLLLDGVLTNNEISFPLFIEHVRKKITVAVINERGYFVDRERVYPEEITDFHVTDLPRTIPKKVVKWNFELNKWEYANRPKTQEELLLEENEKLKSENQMTAIAMMELTESVLGGK